MAVESELDALRQYEDCADIQKKKPADGHDSGVDEIDTEEDGHASAEEDEDEDDEPGQAAVGQLQAEAEALTDLVLEALVNKLEGRGGDLMEPLCSLVALLPQEAAVRELLKLATLKKDPYKVDLQIALQQAGTVVGLLSAAVRGSAEAQRLAKLALAAIATNSGVSPLSAETVPPSPLGLTPNITPLNTPYATPVATPLQGHALPRHDCHDPVASLLQGVALSIAHAAPRQGGSETVKKLQIGSRIGIFEFLRKPPTESHDQSEPSLGSIHDGVETPRDDSSDSTCEFREHSVNSTSENIPTKGGKSPTNWPITPTSWASSAYPKGTIAALKRAMVNKWGSREDLRQEDS